MKSLLILFVTVASSYSQWGYLPSLYSVPSMTSSPLMTGTFVSKDIVPNGKLIAKTYNSVWGYEGEDADKGNKINGSTFN